MSNLLNTLAGVSTGLQIGGTALSLVGAAKAFVSPTNKPDITSGFLFDIPQTETVKLQAEITDHFTEDNEAIEDHVAFKPIQLTLTGIVGELIYTQSAIEKYIQQVLDRLGPLNVIAPAKSQSAQRYLSEYSRLSSAAGSVMKTFNDVGGLFDSEKYGKNRQQEAFSKIQNLFYSRQVVKIETPWLNLPSMILESVEFSQEESTKDQSTVTCNFKEIRVVSTSLGLGVPITNRNQAKSTPVKPHGPVPDESLLYQAKYGKLATGG